jgi:hypothetical protein
MIKVAIKEGCLPNKVNKSLITLLFKSSEKENLSNWFLIILLNVFYKVLLKFIVEIATNYYGND